MVESLKTRLREKMLRQLNEDGSPSSEPDDPREVSVESDLETLATVDDDDPLLETLAERYLVP